MSKYFVEVVGFLNISSELLQEESFTGEKEVSREVVTDCSKKNPNNGESWVPKEQVVVCIRGKQIRAVVSFFGGVCLQERLRLIIVSSEGE